MPIREKQAKKLAVKPWTQISEYLKKCCLLVSANNSYQRTEEDLALLTGMRISASTQQRLVQRQAFEAVVVTEQVKAISLDGGKVRLRTPTGQESVWNDYKAVAVEGHVNAYFKQNQTLVTWVNAQPLAASVSCLGDGHEGIWNLFAQIGDPTQRREILDWFHLMQNLHKVAVPANRLHPIKGYLWQGNLNQAIWALLRDSSDSALKFIAYLQTHHTRIPDYQALQQGGFTIGSGAVESLVKQINRRLKISGAQWSAGNVPQVLKHRVAYLNGDFTRAQSQRTIG